jgi:uncharacterized protein YaeQ
VKFTFQARIDDVHEEKIVLAAAPTELAWHIALKLIGWVLFFEQRPRIEEGVDWRYKPDLIATDPQGNLKLCIDCGNIAIKKIDKVATKMQHERFVILRRTPREADRLVNAFGTRVKRPERVELVSFDEGFVDALADWFDSSNQLTCRRANDRLEVVLENRRGRLARATTIHRRAAAR